MLFAVYDEVPELYELACFFVEYCGKNFLRVLPEREILGTDSVLVDVKTGDYSFLGV